MHSALPARLLVDDTHTYILKNSERGNPVSAPEVGGNIPLLTVDSTNPLKESPHLEVVAHKKKS